MSETSRINEEAGNSAPQSRVFYGWWVVLASIVGLALGISAIIFVSFGIFIAPLEQDFGWSRSETSLALTIALYTTIITSVFVGVLLNRWGVRKVLIVSIVLFGLAMASMPLMTDSIWHFYGMYLLLPLLGAATAPISYSRILVSWFRKQRGLALGIGMSGVGIAAVGLPLFVQAVVDAAGWRAAYLGIAILILLVSLPMVVLLIRDTPEELGLLPDGENFSEGKSAAPPDPGGSMVSEALRQRDFWLMSIAFFFLGVALTAIMAHMVPMLIDRGIAPSRAATIASILGASLLCGRILAGYLLDRFFAPYVAVLFLLGPVLGFALLATGVDGIFIYLAAIVIGLALGAEFDVIPYFTSCYFGLRNYSQLYGILYAIFLLGGGIGPLAMGMSFDKLGDYSYMLWVSAGLTLLSCLLILCLGPYRYLKIS